MNNDGTLHFYKKERTTQNLVDNTKWFEKKILKPGGAIIQISKEHRLNY